MDLRYWKTKNLFYVTLMIPDPKPFVNFFHDLANIISHFEKPLIYEGLQQETLKEFIP